MIPAISTMSSRKAVKINAAGLKLIKEFEGLSLDAYRCPAGKWTIGYGHTGSDVHEGMTITEKEAEALLKHDLEHFEHGVDVLTGPETTDNQYSAMVSLAYNIGLGAFARSSVLTFHRKKFHDSAAMSFELWNKSKGKVLPGLTRRREAERDLYETP